MPWPTSISSQQFSILDASDKRFGELPSDYDYFSFEPEERDEDKFRADVEAAIQSAKSKVDRIHAIVFPELSLTDKLFKVAEEIAIAETAILIAGALMNRDGAGLCNVAAIQTMGVSQAHELASPDNKWIEAMRIVQGKHHRWCLDRNQILQYGLGGRIPASKDCWEATPVANRELHFFTYESWLTWAVLICEDLARQDPVVEALRAVGPNLLIALLMDGPQLRNRWPARYASVLAEDPGCSVLTLTSVGMSGRSKPRSRETDRSRTIGLWRDAIYGDQELELEGDSVGCVLSLVCKVEEEYTIDGRGDGGNANFPVYAGLHPVFLKSKQASP